MEDSIRIRTLDGQYRLIGGDFQSMLEFVREQPKRRYRPNERIWEIPAQVEAIQEAAEDAGFHVTADTEVGHALQRSRKPRKGQADQISVQLEDGEYAVVGGQFYPMLNAVKAIEGRRWQPQQRAWQLPVTLADLRETVSEYGFQVVTPEEAAELPPTLEQEATDTKTTSPSPPFPSRRRDQIRIRGQDGEDWVVGGDFRAMLGAIKSLEGRRFVSEEKLWEIPAPLAAIQTALATHGFHLESAESQETNAVPEADAETEEPPGQAEELPDIPWEEPPVDEEDQYLF